MKNARGAALQALFMVRKRGVFAEEALNVACEALSVADRSLAVRLCLGVLQNRIYLDWCIGQMTALTKLEPQTLDILRMGVYQLFFTDKIPARAAVSESVELAKQKAPRAAGLVNAVLRRLSGAPVLKPPRDERYISTMYSLPQWLSDRLVDILGNEEAELFAATVNEIPTVTLHANPIKKSVLKGAEPHPWLKDSYTFQGDPMKLAGFAEGGAIVADAAAGLTLAALAPREGQSVWDTCAAPGGKSFLSAFAMKNSGYILSTDISEKKLPVMRQDAERLGIDILEIVRGDAREYSPERLFDAVLCDVPCSGMGVIRKKPEIRYKDPRELERLPQIQKDILTNASRFVKPGGTLVYSTCTFLPEENQHVVDSFLKDNADFVSESFTLPGSAGNVPSGQIMLWPHIHGTDGFFIAKLRRK